jgi:hypothetical protein
MKVLDKAKLLARIDGIPEASYSLELHKLTWDIVRGNFDIEVQNQMHTDDKRQGHRGFHPTVK